MGQAFSNMFRKRAQSKIGVARFESGEHEAIGDSVSLTYSQSQKVSGKDFGYTVGTHSLSYGQIVALAGDFYANWSASPGDVEQISDNWDTNPEQSIALALKNAQLLSSNEGGYIDCILSTMTAEDKDVQDGLKASKDPAQVYHSITSGYNEKYAYCTNLGYAYIGLCNWDHFGNDAIKAYSAVHTAALRQAKQAHDSRQDADLKQAYFLEAFAQHFLTDLFATGHMRTPRRILHENLTGDRGDPRNISLYPADSCAQKMHDEDNANGLWVSNQLGESWVAYGDKQWWSGKSAQNRLQVAKAAQAGIDEIWNTYNTGVIPNASDFVALKMIPIIGDLVANSNLTNSIPMFQWNTTNPDSLLFRTNLDIRSSTQTTSLPSKQGFLGWNSTLNTISASGEDTNMYPFTKEFLSDTNVLHTRLGADNSTIILNRYGPVDSGAYGQNWNMVSQSAVTTSNLSKPVQWVTSTSLGSVVSLVGRINSSDSASSVAVHLGLNVDTSNSSQTVITTSWSSAIEDGNSGWAEGDTIYGVYSTDTDDVGMIKYWIQGSSGSSKLELWTIASDLQNAPVKSDLDWGTKPINYVLSYQMTPKDSSSTFVGYGYDAATSSSTWYFSTWQDGYATQSLTTIEESVSFPAQALLFGNLGKSENNNRIVRVFCGPTFPQSGQIRIDVLTASRDQSTGQIDASIDTKSQTFPITWIAADPSNYLTWFLADVNGDGLLDLVTLVAPPTSELVVVVFPGQEDVTFGQPVVTNIQLDPSQGTLLNAAFMKPLTTSQARFDYPTTAISPISSAKRPKTSKELPNPKTRNKPKALSTSYQYNSTSNSKPSASANAPPTAILTLFDNYGILGVRLLAPVTPTGTYTYELKGQTPAIAGQPSTGIGGTDETWMGRGQSAQEIGFFFR